MNGQDSCILDEEWRALQNDSTGEWSICLMRDYRTLAEGCAEIAIGMDKETACHIAAIHNLWLASKIG